MLVQNNQSVSTMAQVAEKIYESKAGAITQLMVQSLMAGLSDKLDFAQLYDRHVTQIEQMDINAASPETQQVFAKLFLKTLEYIKTNSSQVLIPTLAQIDLQTGIPQASSKFLMAFVTPAIAPTIEMLNLIKC